MGKGVPYMSSLSSTTTGLGSRIADFSSPFASSLEYGDTTWCVHVWSIGGGGGGICGLYSVSRADNIPVRLTHLESRTVAVPGGEVL